MAITKILNSPWLYIIIGLNCFGWGLNINSIYPIINGLLCILYGIIKALNNLPEGWGD